MARQSDLIIRKIEQRDNSQMAGVVREVMPEFGATGPGFAIVDPALGCLFETYSDEDCAYFVIEHQGKVVGGAGIAPLIGEKSSAICELQKMYFLPWLRGQGLGQKMMDLCLNFAKGAGFCSCYIETLTGMDEAKKLYLKNNFAPLSAPMGNTGHFKCDCWYLLKFE